MARLAVLGQKQIKGVGDRWYTITQVNHDGGASNTVEIDQTASSVTVHALDGQTAPTLTLEATAPSSSSGDDVAFHKTVTVANGESGKIDIIALHGIQVGTSAVS